MKKENAAPEINLQISRTEMNKARELKMTCL
jgi:hypothetical protein